MNAGDVTKVDKMKAVCAVTLETNKPNQAFKQQTNLKFILRSQINVPQLLNTVFSAPENMLVHQYK